MSENAPTRSLDDIDLAALRVSINTILLEWFHYTLLHKTRFPVTCPRLLKHQRNKVGVRYTSFGLLSPEKSAWICGRCFCLGIQKLTCCPFCGTMDFFFLCSTQKLTFFLSDLFCIKLFIFQEYNPWSIQINVEKNNDEIGF